MCVAVDIEQVAAGYINRNKTGTSFTLEEIYNYIGTLWNAGCGPIRLNFTRDEMTRFLDSCVGICLNKTENGWLIDKSLLSSEMSEKERELMHGDPDLAKSFDLFCRLQVDFRTPNRLLDAMGYRFLYS